MASALLLEKQRRVLEMDARAFIIPTGLLPERQKGTAVLVQRQHPYRCCCVSSNSTLDTTTKCIGSGARWSEYASEEATLIDAVQRPRVAE
ncbi:hypothetical protein G3A39_10080 [Paraburkholderia aspalathi]|uniref:hypothetical protein n=1 Tax=Paraburkholderia nemoris TaxID=2793076 RepID=UPI001909B136|nr:hypothetical protein [Paraburkholderia nemoris]MBK3739570.1 hypothetical protein [Paraburkholderia aspalathi]